MMQFTLLKSRVAVQLGTKLAQGGEGAIYEVAGRGDCVAKVYLKQPDEWKVQKLIAMQSLLTEPLKRVSAWPLDLLADRKKKVCGFIMPKISARKDIHELYSPKNRATSFPEADFRFLVHVCGNIARAFRVIHRLGHVIGDVNHGSVLVGPDGTVAIIDCDSFQIATPTNQIFTCDVGVLLFTAPEIQGQSLRGFRRTPNHDHFGLAVLVFHILCMGRHPFAGRFSGSGDMPIEKAIAESRFAYGQNRRALKMDRPPGTPPLEVFGAAVSGLFEKAFAKHGTSGGRPDDQAWIRALDELKSKLRVCSRAAWHHYPNDLQACPWCEVELKTGVRLFGHRIAPTVRTGVVDVGQLWKAITSIPLPGPEPSMPSDLPWSAPPGVNMPDTSVTGIRKVIGCMLIAIGVFGCFASGPVALLIAVAGLAVFPWVTPGTRANAQRAVATAEAAYLQARQKWQLEATTARLETKRRELELARDALIDLPNERRRRLAKLNSEREFRQRKQHRDKYKIKGAKIRGVGASRTAMLASFGIETADDVVAEDILQIAGIGETITKNLIDWRKDVEKQFRYNSKAPLDPQESAALDLSLNQTRQQLITQLQQGPMVLMVLAQETVAARQRLMPVLERLWTDVMIAKANRDAL